MKTALGPSLAILAIAAFSVAPGHAQLKYSRDSEPAWLSLERGERAYTEKDFGAAIVAFDSAIAERRRSFDAASLRLDQVLASKAAKSAADSIRAALAAFAAEDFIQRDYKAIVSAHGSAPKALFEALRKQRISDSHRAFIDVLLLVLEYRTMESLDDSISKLRSEVALLSRYPEAEYWKGKAFFIEGELGLAESQYLRAFDMRESLDVPQERYTILYSMAALYDAKGDFVAWENVMARILSADAAAGASVAVDSTIDPFLKEAMMSTLLDAGFDKFMTLYRIEPSYSLEAHSELARFYLERGRADATLHAAVAVNMTLTRAIAMMLARDRDYAWKGLADFRRRAVTRRDISAYLADNGIDRLFLTLADALYIEGSRLGASELWKSIAASGTSPYSAVASERLANPAQAVRRTAP